MHGLTRYRGQVWLVALAVFFMVIKSDGTLAGSIVVGDDVNTFGTTLAGPNEAQFAINVADFLTAGKSLKNLLLFEATPGDGTRDFSPVILNALTGAGFSVTVTTDYTMSVSGFDAIFTEEKFPAIAFLDNNSLVNYVNGGGGVYIVGGVGEVAPTEAAGWATFLNAFGLGLEPVYNGFTNIPITSSNVLFAGVPSLAVGNGQSIIDLGTDPNAQIIQTFQGQNVFAEVTASQVPVYEPTTLTLLIVSLVGFVVLQRMAHMRHSGKLVISHITPVPRHALAPVRPAGASGYHNPVSDGPGRGLGLSARESGSDASSWSRRFSVAPGRAAATPLASG